MLYDDASKRLILSFKHGDRTHLAKTLAGWMHRAATELWEQTDFIVPVPLHRWRLYKRRYNQAALLTQTLGKSTQTQGHMNRKERQANVKGAFKINPRCAEQIKDKNILLIDDVLTTGATLNECCETLLDAGAKSVSALTLARVRGYM